jgi:hypothetical protein
MEYIKKNGEKSQFPPIMICVQDNVQDNDVARCHLRT